MRHTAALILVCTSAFAAPAAPGAELIVGQKNKEFSHQTLKAKVGDTVDFRNDDPYFHNVFSLSDTKSFDLGTFPQSQSRKVTFDKAGKVQVECSIHPGMMLLIEVEK